MDILKQGIIESDDQLLGLAQEYGQLVIPNEDDELPLTHWWVLLDEGAEVLYVGTPETFLTYVRERNGGIQ